MRHPHITAKPLPAGIPVLGAGAHDKPEHGACFMEYASVLAGERFSDRPRCTHPVLAAACRAINDHISEAGRQRLVPCVPDVVSTASRNPRVSAALVIVCADAAEPYAPGHFDQVRSDALRRLDRYANGGWAGIRVRCSECDYRLGAAGLVNEAVTVIGHRGGDAALYALLVDLIACCRATGHAPASGRRSTSSSKG